MRPIDADTLKRHMGIEDAVKYGNETEEQQHNSYATLMNYEISDFIDDMPTLDYVPRQQWISVKDRLPEKGEKVLVRGIKGGIQAGLFRGLSAPGRERMWSWKKHTCLEVVCWMPQSALPEPPKEE